MINLVVLLNLLQDFFKVCHDKRTMKMLFTANLVHHCWGCWPGTSVSEKALFDVANTAIGNVSQKKEKKTREKKKEGKNVLIHSCRCVTLLLPQQKFTTELMTKGWAPCSLLWSGEQYVGCEWLIPRDLWQVGPLSNLGDSFLHWAGPPFDRDGKTQATYSEWAFAQSRDWEPLWRENIISIVRLWPSL